MAAVTLPNYRKSNPIFTQREILGANPYPLRFMIPSVQIAANQTVNLDPNFPMLLPVGSIVGIATSGANSGKGLLWSSTAVDGSQNIAGVLYDSVDTSQGVQGAPVLISANLLQDKLFAASGTTVPPVGTILAGTSIQLEASIVPGAPY